MSSDLHSTSNLQISDAAAEAPAASPESVDADALKLVGKLALQLVVFSAYQILDRRFCCLGSGSRPTNPCSN